MGEKNCRTAEELDEETSRLYELLDDASIPDPGVFETAASRACDSTLAGVMARIDGGPLADPWMGRIQTILDQRRTERASGRTRAAHR